MVDGANTVAPQDPRVTELLAQLEACRGLHSILDTVKVIAARYAVGQQWGSQRTSQVGAVLPTKTSGDDPVSVVNMIGPHVRQWQGRLEIGDYRAAFRPQDSSPETHLTARQLQRWYDYFMSESTFPNKVREANFSRIVTGHQCLTWYFDDNAPGGVDTCLVDGHLTIDTANKSWELEDHEYYIHSAAISTADARRQYGHYGVDQKAFESDAMLSDLRTLESYLGRALYGLQPGAGDSITTGVIVHRKFYDYGRRLLVVIQNPMPKGKKVKPGQILPDYHVVGDWSWRWGNPYLKLDCFKNIAMAFGNGLVMELVPHQNCLNLAVRKDIRNYVLPSYRWVAWRGTVENETALTHGADGSVVWLSQNALQEKLVPQMIQRPAYDSKVDSMIQRAMSFMDQTSSLTPTLQGQAKTGREPYAALEILRRQGLVPLESVADCDKRRLELFLNRMARAALDHYGRTNPGLIAKIVGKSFGNRKLGQVAGATLRGNTTCVMRDDAFLALTAQEKEARLMSLVTAGRIQATDLPEEMYELTGYQVRAGQNEEYQAAHEIIRRVMADEPDSQVYLTDPLKVIIRCIRAVMRDRLTQELSRQQITRLQATMNECKRLLAMEAEQDAALAGVGGPQEPEEPQQPTAPTGPTGPVPEIAAGMGNEPVVLSQ